MADNVSSVSVQQRSAAKVAALAFPISMVCIGYSNYGIREGMSVEGNLPETVRRLGEAASLARLSVFLDIAYCTGFIVLASALYVVLAPVNRRIALVAGMSKLVYVGCMLMIALSFLTIVRLSSDPSYMQALGAGAVQALVKLNYAATWDQYYVGLPFWSLSSLLFAWLWLKSRYIPAWLALFGIAASAWCLFCAVVYLIKPAFGGVVNLWLFDMPMVMFYLALSIWLLVKGLRPRAMVGT